MSRPPFNLRAVERATLIGMSMGHRVFQTHFFGDSDHEQVSFLLEQLNPAQGSIVLDAGCGIGEVSRLMAEMRPDLSFVLSNISPYQLSLCPKGEPFLPLLGDCHDLDINDASIDAVMFSSALCQMDEDVALSEAARVMRDGGVLLINDMARSDEDGGALEHAVAARVLQQSELVDSIEAAGFTIDKILTPGLFSDAHFRELLAADGLEQLINNVFPIVIRATKGRVAA